MNLFQSGFTINNQSGDPLALERVFRRPAFFWRKKDLLEYLYTRVANLHQRAVEGDKTAVHEAFVLLENIRDHFPPDPLIDAYFGSILAFQGRDALDPIERVEKVRQGLKFLDEAVQNEPERLEIRILRGYVCLRLPEVFFHRTSVAVEDFNYLITRYEKDPNIFSAEFGRQLLKELKSAYQTLGRDQECQRIQAILNKG